MIISRKKVLKAFFFASNSQLLNLVIFLTALFIIRWSLQSSFDISKEDIPSTHNFVIFCFQHFLDPSLYLYFNIYYG